MLFKKTNEKTQLIINIEKIDKEQFRKICEKSGVTMTDVLTYAIKQINEEGEIKSVNFRTNE